MIDLEWVRTRPQALDEALLSRGGARCADQVVDLDRQVRECQTALQALQAQRNGLAEKVAQAKRSGQDATSYTEQAQALKTLVPQKEAELHELTQTLTNLLSSLPNPPHASVPHGQDEHGNQELRRHGVPTVLDFTPQPHQKVKAASSWMDEEQAVAMSGSRFVLLQGPLARLERALAQFMLDLHTETWGYQEVTPPYLVREQALYHTGQLPKMREDLFQTLDHRWLIPTSEVSLTNLAVARTFSDDMLPLRYVAYTPCFRKEAGAAGRDTQGLIRLHQFPKVELVSITAPEQSDEEHERMTAAAEDVLKRLELPYRVMVLCAGDMGFSARKTYDLEVWFPHQGCYREISSCSNCGDFQARRMKARYKNPEHPGQKFVHTLNGSGVAVGRALAAVIENYQQADGSIVVPEVLRPYMRGVSIIHERA